MDVAPGADSVSFDSIDVRDVRPDYDPELIQGMLQDVAIPCELRGSEVLVAAADQVRARNRLRQSGGESIRVYACYRNLWVYDAAEPGQEWPDFTDDEWADRLTKPFD